MRAQIKPTYQIQRINFLKNRLTEISQMDRDLFMMRPNEKTWCGAEVIKHMVMAQKAYEPKVEKALSESKESESENDVLSARAIPSFLIKRFPPIEGKIRFKMKTTKQFKPMLNAQNLIPKEVDDLIGQMSTSLSQLENWIEQTQKKDVRAIRFNSAIGSMVKFNVSEACEFILCHNERHFQQLQNTIKTVKEGIAKV